ncbi:alkylated DNA repair protein [Parvularcula bermudensis HTCC2503]|uniref:Alkylated DNA repair protein n=1 Tax=Parvularcula bermudensis (strain ATCC BAA-594 / HTCC2503 / KCTC 12087) TaxID=314260 RepID=E0THL4_PARBH|nr:alpha-ketoglutarate-dependent dioxygenase AlkB [Parvularcula bermudensis]ADM09310.1 alkylated DNA repair protein [Parvularcula bermudensis HTCC2503]
MPSAPQPVREVVDLGEGACHLPGYLPAKAASDLQQHLIHLCQDRWIVPVTPGGQTMSARQMNLGPLGWVTDRRGYRYEPRHPVDGAAWPEMPPALIRIWNDLLPEAPSPEAGLVNLYGPTAKMGLHRDADEAAKDVPILSVSFGAPGRFRLGGATRKGSTRSIVLGHGDVLILAGPSRHFYHGIDRILLPSPLFAEDPHRLSLTLRRVTPSTSEGTSEKLSS